MFAPDYDKYEWQRLVELQGSEDSNLAFLATMLVRVINQLEQADEERRAWQTAIRGISK